MRLTSEQIVASLIARGVPEHVARGVTRNFQSESGLDTGIQEKAPLAGRGGFGLAQWTGPRRIALEDFARSQGRPVDNADVQLDFFMNENAGPESGAWKRVMASPDEQSAAINFVKHWERPTSENVAKRTAQYMGDSPSEGGGRFGGTGLGTPAAGGETTTFTHPVTGTPVTPLPAAAKPKTLGETIKAGVGDLMESLGSMAGGGQTSPLPTSTVPRMGGALRTAPTGPMAAADTSAQDQLRAQLAQRMALLNSGKLF